MSRYALRAALAFCAGILITAGGCTGSPSGASVAEQPRYTLLRVPAGPSFSIDGSQTASQTIGAEGGVLQTREGHRLVFPAGAVAEPTEISMTTRAGYVGVVLEPHGLQFPAGREPVLTLSTVGSEVAAGSKLTVLYVDEADTPLEVLPAESDAATLMTRLRHFSSYVGAQEERSGGYVGSGN